MCSLRVQRGASFSFCWYTCMRSSSPGVVYTRSIPSISGWHAHASEKCAKQCVLPHTLRVLRCQDPWGARVLKGPAWRQIAFSLWAAVTCPPWKHQAPPSHTTTVKGSARPLCRSSTATPHASSPPPLSPSPVTTGALLSRAGRVGRVHVGRRTWPLTPARQGARHLAHR